MTKFFRDSQPVNVALIIYICKEGEKNCTLPFNLSDTNTDFKEVSDQESAQSINNLSCKHRDLSLRAKSV